MTPPQVRRIIRIARFGARVPKVPQYAEAFQAIGPAAIKLGQALATRPDLVGTTAAHDLQRLQDRLPALPFPVIKAAIERGPARPSRRFGNGRFANWICGAKPPQLPNWPKG